MIVQRAIKLNSGLDVSFNTAASTYINSNNPSASALDFRQALYVLYETFLMRVERTNKFEKHLLSRIVMQSVLRLKKRNKHQEWWPEEEEVWGAIVQRIIHKHQYRWYFNPGLFFVSHASLRHVPALCRFTLFKSGVDEFVIDDLKLADNATG